MDKLLYAAPPLRVVCLHGLCPQVGVLVKGSLGVQSVLGEEYLVSRCPSVHLLLIVAHKVDPIDDIEVFFTEDYEITFLLRSAVTHAYGNGYSCITCL